MPTRSRYVEENIRSARRAFVRSFSWALALAVVVVLGAAAWIAWALMPLARQLAVDTGLLVAFAAGAGLASAIAVVVHFLGMDGARTWREGGTAETWTADALKRFRRDGWKVFHDVEFDRCNVDHVLVGPRGVIAIETKYRSPRWPRSPAEDTALDPEDLHMIQAFADDARHRAARLRSLLRAGGVVTRVQPALVVWGRGMAGNAPTTIDGVEVCPGPQMRRWRESLTGSPLTAEEIRLSVAAIRARKRGRAVGPPLLPEAPTHRSESPLAEAEPARPSEELVGAGLRN